MQYVNRPYEFCTFIQQNVIYIVGTGVLDGPKPSPVGEQCRKQRRKKPSPVGEGVARSVTDEV